MSSSFNFLTDELLPDYEALKNHSSSKKYENINNYAHGKKP